MLGYLTNHYYTGKCLLTATDRTKGRKKFTGVEPSFFSVSVINCQRKPIINITDAEHNY